MLQTTKISAFVLLLMIVALQGCSHPKRVAAVPETLTDKAEIPGMPGIRFFADDENALMDIAVDVLKREREYYGTGPEGELPPFNVLAVSGGGDNGAFGAGVLVGWTEHGTRPDFNIVTGISTGALTAPFAFLGPEYDGDLKTVYTTINPDSVLRKRNLLAAFFNDGLADNQPLFELVSVYATEDMLEKVAQEYTEKGRLLLIGTTDLDSRKTVIWNMGEIAASNHPDALDLFRRILVASAAIPGAFPPTMFDVEVNGQAYQEMHVDGGAISQVFAYPAAFVASDYVRRLDIKRKSRNLYVIRNDREHATWQSVERQTLKIAGRAISSIIHKEGIGDLYQIYLVGQRDNFDFNLAIIGPDFTATSDEIFNTAWMNKLYNYGYQLSRKGYPWKKRPPGFAKKQI